MRPTSKTIACLGVTLIDLCLACCIIVVLAGLSIPSINNWRTRHKLQAEASAIGSTLSRTLNRATIERSQYKVVVAEQQLTVQNSTGASTSIQRLAPGFYIIPPLPAPIIFSPGLVASPSRIILSAQEMRCEITLSLRGRVQTRC